MENRNVNKLHATNAAAAVEAVEVEADASRFGVDVAVTLQSLSLSLLQSLLLPTVCATNPLWDNSALAVYLPLCLAQGLSL